MRKVLLPDERQILDGPAILYRGHDPSAANVQLFQAFGLVVFRAIAAQGFTIPSIQPARVLCIVCFCVYRG